MFFCFNKMAFKCFLLFFFWWFSCLCVFLGALVMFGLTNRLFRPLTFLLFNLGDLFKGMFGLFSRVFLDFLNFLSPSLRFGLADEILLGVFFADVH